MADSVIIEQCGSMSLVKAKTDWLNINKIHLSFVQHTGLKNGCKRVASIEAALPIYLASGMVAEGSNAPEDNSSGLEKLVYMVNSKSLFTRLDASRKAALAQNPNADKVYPASVFEFMGGSTDKSTGKIRYRKISIGPAMIAKGRPNKNIVLKCMECDGKTTATGGLVALPEYPNQVSISVPFKPAEFVVFIMAIKNAWQAELCKRAITGTGEFETWHDKHKNDGQSQEANAAVPQSSIAADVPVADTNGDRIELVIAYDQLGLLFVVTTPANFQASLRKGLEKMLASEKQWVMSKDEAQKLLQAIQTGTSIPVVTMTSKVDASFVNHIFCKRISLSARH